MTGMLELQITIAGRPAPVHNAAPSDAPAEFSMAQFISSLPQVDSGISDKLATEQAADRSDEVSAAFLGALSEERAMQQLTVLAGISSVAIAGAHAAACADHLMAGSQQLNDVSQQNKFEPEQHFGHAHDDEHDQHTAHTEDEDEGEESSKKKKKKRRQH